jgi:hypothetical protein
MTILQAGSAMGIYFKEVLLYSLFVTGPVSWLILYLKYRKIYSWSEFKSATQDQIKLGVKAVIIPVSISFVVAILTYLFFIATGGLKLS